MSFQKSQMIKKKTLFYTAGLQDSQKLNDKLLIETYKMQRNPDYIYYMILLHISLYCNPGLSYQTFIIAQWAHRDLNMWQQTIFQIAMTKDSGIEVRCASFLSMAFYCGPKRNVPKLYPTTFYNCSLEKGLSWVGLPYRSNHTLT